MSSKFTRFFFNGFTLKVFIAVWILSVIWISLTTFLLPDVYSSTAYVRLQTGGTDPSWIELKDQSKVVVSPAVLNLVIKQLNLNEKWGREYFQGELLKTSETFQIISNRLAVTSIKNSPVLEIKSFSPHPDEAALIANAVADAFQVYSEENQTKTQADKSGAGQPAIISVQIDGQAEPPLRPFKPNRPVCIIIGMFCAVLYGAMGVVLAVGGRWLIGKIFAGKPNYLKDRQPPSPSVKQLY